MIARALFAWLLLCTPVAAQPADPQEAPPADPDEPPAAVPESEPSDLGDATPAPQPQTEAGADADSIFPRSSRRSTDSIFPRREKDAPLAISSSLCPDAIDLVDPLASSLRDTGLDTARGGCSVDRWTTSFRALALIDEPDFFGTLSGAWFLSRRLVYTGGIELELGARVVDYRFVQNAVVPEDEYSIGPIWVSASRTLRWDVWPDAIVAHRFRLDLPFTDRSYEPVTIGAAPGIDLTAPLWRPFFLHLHARALLWAAIADSQVEERAALSLGSDGVARVTSWLAVGLGLAAQGGWYGAELDHIAARGGLRFGVGDARLELGGAVPFLGEERVDASAQLGFSL